MPAPLTSSRGLLGRSLQRNVSLWGASRGLKLAPRSSVRILESGDESEGPSTSYRSPITLRAEAYVVAPPDRLWSVLTDYNKLADFIPNLEKSRVVSLSSDSKTAVIEQVRTIDSP